MAYLLTTRDYTTTSFRAGGGSRRLKTLKSMTLFKRLYIFVIKVAVWPQKNVYFIKS
jgi:hypothetical protein